MQLFKIKICGVMRAGDFAAITQSGADAVGLNFFPQSKRFVSSEKLSEFASAIPDTLNRVGVFVNATNREIIDASEKTRLDFVQLHGEESPSRLQELQNAIPAIASRIIKAFRLHADPQSQIDPYLKECRQLGISLAGILIDAWDQQEYGGTGKTLDWNSLRDWSASQTIPVILAGGLTPANVAGAIEAVRPYGVDAASGVECAPGEKDPVLVQSFVESAKRGFSRISSHGL